MLCCFSKVSTFSISVNEFYCLIILIKSLDMAVRKVSTGNKMQRLLFVKMQEFDFLRDKWISLVLASYTELPFRLKITLIFSFP